MDEPEGGEALVYCPECWEREFGADDEVDRTL